MGKFGQTKKRPPSNGDDVTPKRKQLKLETQKAEQIVTDINVEGFVESRSLEIQALTDVVKNVGGNHQAFQKLPRHMRRRAMSHNIKRVPSRLHAVAKSELEKTKAPGKRPSRRYRRRPSNLLAEYNRRKRKIGWLETHIWHAKRFKMVDKWGYRLALHPNDKSIRACYRAVAKHCLLQDVSYENYIEIKGPKQMIIDALSHLTSTKLGLTFASKTTSSGKFQGRVTLYCFDSYPHSVIGPVTYLWCPCNSQDSATLWICSHPAISSQVRNEVNKCFDKTSSTGLGTPNLSLTTSEGTTGNQATDISISSLKDQLVKFRLLGPAANVVLSETLQVANVKSDGSLSQGRVKSSSEKDYDSVQNIKNDNSGTDSVGNNPPDSEKEKYQEKCDKDLIHPWWKKFYSLTESDHVNDFQEQTDMWSKLVKCHSPAEAPPNCILALTVRDPRILLPPKRNKMYTIGIGTMTNSLPLELFTASVANSPLWQANIREEVKETKIPEHKLNEMKSKQLIPGTQLDLGEKESRIPVLLIQRPGTSSAYPSSSSSSSCRSGYASGWDIIIPAGWAMAFWVALVYRGARVGGLREGRSTALFAGLLSEPYDFPDLAAGETELKAESEALQSRHDRRPPAKRPNYTKLGFSSPFTFEFDNLVDKWSSPYCEIVKDLNKSTQSELQLPQDFASKIKDKSYYILREVKLLRLLNSAVTDLKGFMKSKDKNQRGQVSKKNMTVLEKLLASETGRSLVEQHSRALVAVSITVPHRGVPAMFGHICLPTADDLKHLDTDKNYGGPLEKKHKDPYEAQRKEERQQRLKRRKKIKRGRREKTDAKSELMASVTSSSVKEEFSEKNTETSVEITSETPAKTDNISNGDKADHEDSEMDVDQNKSQAVCIETCRMVIGFVRNGDFDLGRGQGSGIGFCSVAALMYLLKEQSNRKSCLVLIRNPTSLQYRFASISVII